MKILQLFADQNIILQADVSLLDRALAPVKGCHAQLSHLWLIQLVKSVSCCNATGNCIVFCCFVQLWVDNVM